jgi:hypothetical protein
MAKLRNKLRGVLSAMCLELPSTNDTSDIDDSKIHFHRHIRPEPAETPSYPRNTLMGLPVELRTIIHQFALQDVVDTIRYEDMAFFDRTSNTIRIAYLGPITYEPPPLSSGPLRHCFNGSLQHGLFLGGLALPHTTRAIRKESLDVYGPFLKLQQQSIWERYVKVQILARVPGVSELEQWLLLDEEADALSHWSAVGKLRMSINRMYCNDCFARDYWTELHTKARLSEWRARV